MTCETCTRWVPWNNTEASFRRGVYADPVFAPPFDFGCCDWVQKPAKTDDAFAKSP